VLQGDVFAETQADELKRPAEAGEHGAEGHEASLGLSAFALAVPGTPEEAYQRRHVGKVDVGAVGGQHAKPVVPQQRRGETLLVSLSQATAQHAPEAEGQLLAGLAESLFGEPGCGQPRAEGADQSPGLGQALGHGAHVQADIHHQPGDDLRDQRPATLGRAACLASHGHELLGGEEVPERRQSKLLQKVCSETTRATDRIHESASMPVERMVVLQDHPSYTILRLPEAFFIGGA
jgi:hypothetical protein